MVRQLEKTKEVKKVSASYSSIGHVHNVVALLPSSEQHLDFRYYSSAHFEHTNLDFEHVKSGVRVGLIICACSICLHNLMCARNFRSVCGDPLEHNLKMNLRCRRFK